MLRTIAERHVPLVVPAFYWKLLAAEGLGPQLDDCVRCGETGPGATLVAFDIDEGGVHVPNVPQRRAARRPRRWG